MEVDNRDLKNPPEKQNIGHKPQVLNVEPAKPHQKPHVPRWSFLKTIFGGIFGVQSDAQRKADFENHTPSRFVFLGIIAAIIIVITMITIVSLVTDIPAPK